MSVSIVVPFRPDGAERDRNWDWIAARYKRLYPDWQVVVGYYGYSPWCKGRAVTDAVEACDGDKLVISDADMYLHDEVMREGVKQLEDYAWVVPHTRCWRLTENATRAFMAGFLEPQEIRHDHLEMPPRHMYPCGGLFFIRKDAYLDAGGIDQRFKGWGGEDESFGIALETLYGPPKLLGSVLIHFHHKPQPEMPPDRGRPAHADVLVKRYEAAKGDPKKMRALIA